MGEEFRDLQHRLKITTIYVTHDQEEAMALSDRVVVMQRGRVLQSGAPEAVYCRPASAEVAAFFGTPNLIEATVRACRANGGDHVLSVEAEPGAGDCRAAGPFAAGERVLVMVRPEDVALAAPDTRARDGQFAWPGRIVDGVFRGPRRTLTVQSEGRRFQVECPASRAMAVGDTVTLVVDADHAWALPAGSPAPSSRA
jgi:iron(III) transport system ATP-binding protein